MAAARHVCYVTIISARHSPDIDRATLSVLLDNHMSPSRNSITHAKKKIKMRIRCDISRSEWNGISWQEAKKSKKIEVIQERRNGKREGEMGWKKRIENERERERKEGREGNWLRGWNSLYCISQSKSWNLSQILGLNVDFLDGQTTPSVHNSTWSIFVRIVLR